MASGKPVAITRRHSPASGRRLAAAVCAVSLLSAVAAAQDPPPETPPALPTAAATLVLEGRPVATVPVTLAGDGPRLALVPIAKALGVEVLVGPLGDSHTLIYEDRRILVGPGQSMLVTVAPDGRTQKAITRLRWPPMRDASGLKVSLELLERALGEPLNYRFAWNPETLTLAVAQPELRQLRSAINVVHQHQVSLVEIEFSAEPRFRVEQRPGTLEIRLVGDRLQLPVRTPQETDPLVREIAVAPDYLRLRLAPNAVAAEPRLLLRPMVRLVVEVFEGTAPRDPDREPRSRPVRRSAPGIRTIAIDPGHGGSETGAVGPGGSEEADITLLVARALRHQLERRLPVKVILTRDDDVDVALENRAAVANQNQADLFISLHCNSSFGSRAHGAETYFLSREASDQVAAEVAAAENRSALAQDPELGLQMILWDLAQSYHLAESQRFANLVQEELNLALGLRDRGVKQAPFSVLMGAQMPAVLVELGFLSNPEEEAELNSPTYRAELVDALVRAVTRFKRQVESDEIARAGPEMGARKAAGTSDPP